MLSSIIHISMFAQIKEFIMKYERYVSPVTLVTGFIFDSLMLKRIDIFFTNALLISYLLIAALSILILNISVSKREEAEQEGSILHAALVFMMQFSFGGLFSASFLFYSRSGSVAGSWPFLVLILAYILGNELFRKNYKRLGFQVAALFSALFSFLIFFFPVVLRRMDDAMFLLSGIASLILTGFFVYVLSWFTPQRVRMGAPILAGSVFGIFALINTLYFTNLIPPIPLALKELGVYQSLSKFPDGSYLLTGDRRSWFESLAGRATVHMRPDEPLYAFNAIFAPASLSTDIIHVWQYYDEKSGWVTSSQMRLSIIGGRENGFRTYSIKRNMFPGPWRINVETPRGQLLGRLTFDVALADGSEDLVTDVR
jgi:MFS family permease